MHHPRSIADVVRFRIASFLILGNSILAAVTVVLLINSLMTENRQLTMIGAGLMVLSLVLVVAQWSAASRASCPLCRTPVLAPRACMKHRRARLFLGSHRLRVALAVLFKNQFRCPYCNESTSLELIETLRYPPASDTLRIIKSRPIRNVVKIP